MSKQSEAERREYLRIAKQKSRAKLRAERGEPEPDYRTPEQHRERQAKLYRARLAKKVQEAG